MKKLGGMGTGLSSLTGLSGFSIGGAWTPAKPTSGGGVLPHTWHYAGSGALYQDAAQTIPAVADGNPIGASVNQGSDSHTIIQAVAGNKPTLKLNIKNGLPVYRCDGNDYIDATYTGALTDPYTAFSVAKLGAGLANDNVTYYMFGTKGLPVQSNFLKYNGTIPDTFAMRQTNNIDGTITATDTWHIWSGLFNGATSRLWIDGVGGGLLALVSLNPAGFTLGARNGGGLSWNGDIAEILIYDSNLSTADKNQVGQYLSTKYAITYTDIP